MKEVMDLLSRKNLIKFLGLSVKLEYFSDDGNSDWKFTYLQISKNIVKVHKGFFNKLGAVSQMI